MYERTSAHNTHVRTYGGIRSVGRVRALHAQGRRFDFGILQGLLVVCHV